MKILKKFAICAIILFIVLLCAGCELDLQKFENKDARKHTETMLNALIADDFESAYGLVSDICSKSDFSNVFEQMSDLIGDEDTYELKLLSIQSNSKITNGQKIETVDSIYEMTSDACHIIVSIKINKEAVIQQFSIIPYENTDYYSTGTITKMKNATPIQWIFLLANVGMLGIAVIAFTDCLRHKIKNKALWIILILLGFVTVGVAISATSFNFNFNLGWITVYSAFIRYGSGAFVARVMLPIGAIIYLFARGSIMQKKVVEPNLPITEPIEQAENVEPSNPQNIDM